MCDPESRLSGQAAFYGVWDSKALRSLLNGNPALKTALSAALNRKLAEKVAQAGVLTDVIGDTLEASTARAMPAKKSAKARPKPKADIPLHPRRGGNPIALRLGR